jgi:deoxyribose-phosphate aldolase
MSDGGRTTPAELDELVRELLESVGGVPDRPGVVPGWLGESAGQLRGIGAFIDSTLLRPEATRAEVLRHCEEAVALGVKAVCVNGCWIEACAERLRGSGVLVAAVVGFPLGAMAPAAKAAEARLAVEAGAAEVDAVLPLGRLKAGEWREVEEEIRAVVEAAGGAAVKVIPETAALEPKELAAACLLARTAGAAFVKTSTGFTGGGATAEDVKVEFGRVDETGGVVSLSARGVEADVRFDLRRQPPSGGFCAQCGAELELGAVEVITPPDGGVIATPQARCAACGGV